MAWQNPIGRLPSLSLAESIHTLERLAYQVDLDNRELDTLLKDIHALRILGGR